jgi:hypothetical protein
VGGTALAAFLEPLEAPLRVVAIGALLAIGIRGLLVVTIGPRAVPGSAVMPDRIAGTYARYLGLTLLNPQTVVYFAALILALPDLGRGPGGRRLRRRGVPRVPLLALSWPRSAPLPPRLPPRAQVGITSSATPDLRFRDPPGLDL